MTTTRVDPLAERDRLKQQYRSALAAFDTANRRRVDLDEEVKQLQVDTVEAYAAKARGDAAGPVMVAACAEHSAPLVEELNQLALELQGSKQAQEVAQRTLAALLVSELAAFAQEADQATETAREALAALEGPYQRARDAWVAAQSAWMPLYRAILDTMQAREVEAGFYRPSADLHADAEVPRFPIADLTGVFELRPRPAGAPGGETAVDRMLADAAAEEE